MATFYKSQQDGVVGIMGEKEFELFNQLDEGLMEAGEQGWPTPIFTFADPGHKKFASMTGSTDMMAKLLKDHKVIEVMFAVPFSSDYVPKPPRQQTSFETTRQQVIDAFGVDPETLK